MSIEVFLCVPAAIFSVGFLIFSILFMNPDKLKQAPFDIQIGKIDKDLIVRLSKQKQEENQKSNFSSHSSFIYYHYLSLR